MRHGRAIVYRPVFDCSPPDQLVRLVAGASAEEREVLSAYLGQERVERLVGLALQADGRKEARGRVVFVPGFLGSSLTVRREGESRTVWLEHDAIRQGWFRWLRLGRMGGCRSTRGLRFSRAGF